MKDRTAYLAAALGVARTTLDLMPDVVIDRVAGAREKFERLVALDRTPSPETEQERAETEQERAVLLFGLVDLLCPKSESPGDLPGQYL